MILSRLKRLGGTAVKDLCARCVHWTKPLSSSLPLGILADLGRSKSELVAENALLRQQLIMLQRQVKRPVCSQALALFAQEVGVGPDKRLVLLLDRAGWHTSAKLTVPAGIHLVFLPPYSPELQPAERLWPLSNEPLANRSFASLDALEQVQVERCRWLQAQPALIHAYTCFHWWPTSLDAT